MRWKYKKTFLILILVKKIFFNIATASTINAISIHNHATQSSITVYFDTIPTYIIFFLHEPERMVIDFFKTYNINLNKIPIDCRRNNLIKCIRASISENHQSVRMVCDLNYAAYIETLTQKKLKKGYCIVLTLLDKKILIPSSNLHRLLPSAIECNKLYDNNDQKNIIQIKCDKSEYISDNDERKYIVFPVVVVAIDAGHGGQDPGATGCGRKIYEKDITLSIAKKFKNILDFDPMFRPVMIREEDKFLSIAERSNLARIKKADVLISIHADACVNSSVRGASVWILSNQRVKSETAYWLKRQEKHSELLGGIGNILINYRNNPYFNHLVLDLQFGYVQRASYDMATKVLSQLKNVSLLHKRVPEYSNFGILRSPDIPSILVETGFISNFKEENLLSVDKYQEKIALALYKGLRMYFLEYQRKLMTSLSNVNI